MDESPEEAPDGSLNHENTAQSPDDQETYIEGGAGQAPPRGSEDAGVGPPEQTGDKASSHSADGGSRQTDHRISDEGSQPTDHSFPDYQDRKTSQQVDRKSSGQAERRTSEEPGQQLPSLLERKGFEKREDRASLLSGEKASEQADQGTSEYGKHIFSDQDDYSVARKSQRQFSNPTNVLAEDAMDQRKPSETAERDYDRVGYETESQAGYRSYYKTLAQAENRSLSEVDDNQEVNEADFKVQPCTFEDSQTDLRSKVSTSGQIESATTVQAYTLRDTQFTSDAQSSYEKLPFITTKVYYTSNQGKLQTTEVTTDVQTEVEPRKGSQRHSHTYAGRFPPIIFEDPYQVALRYMEKHNILQIFQQITENLVYEKPDDPLYFMLDQLSVPPEKAIVVLKNLPS
ncbi:hypothetical protein STEG23_011167, partial [Scotinomys teguina]